jgi:hypothetical protein
MADEAKPDKPVIAITSLDAFAPGDVDVTLEFEDHIETVPMRALSYAKFQSIGREVKNPLPPITGAGKTGPIFDYKDADYLIAMQEAEITRSCKRLLASLRLDVPGKTDDEKIAYLQGLDVNRMALLMNVVSQLVTEGKAHVEARAATFHGGRKTRQ